MKEQISYYENDVERRKKLKMFEERLEILEALGRSNILIRSCF